MLAIVLVAGIGIGWTIERELVKRRRQAWREKNQAREPNNLIVTKGPWGSAPTAPKPPDAADQLRIVMGAAFTIQPLLNKSEARVFKELDRFVLDCNPG